MSSSDTKRKLLPIDSTCRSNISWLMSMLAFSICDAAEKSATTRWYPRINGRRCSRALRACCSSRHAPAIAEARATLTCQRQRSACLGDMAGNHTTRQRAQSTFGFDGALVHAALEMRRKNVEACERALVARPRGFVRFSTPEQVELFDPLGNRRSNTQVEHGAAHAM